MTEESCDMVPRRARPWKVTCFLCVEKYTLFMKAGLHLSTATDCGGDQTICVPGDAGGLPQSEEASLPETQVRSSHQLPGPDLAVRGQWNTRHGTHDRVLYLNHGRLVMNLTQCVL